ncbi:type II toxin-antitoxin system YafQ family toxin [Helicobacter sp. L8]|nr:type II toxin-antitoxin system YafQ family toxin [Helicobacter sp. L8]
MKPDLLLIYRHVGGILELIRLGSHSDIFTA